ncbi:hypothetical protein [Taylorella equigenitalis]|uniref:hypothetical protein n=1 Tax=Taylorella equigenitalis TaxID=29575 RepID=UPI000425B403|nr:hypothetical protein [Taylorella equigenitalis]ASY42546.1 hypothetical protein CA943_05460 [Taylorella equigenitalis]KGK34114.1 hypothetical protein LW90_00700 [Taylorella equigenitalis]WDU45973.1 hypothetical protein KNO33_05520 [Taylorella equigenitalis]
MKEKILKILNSIKRKIKIFIVRCEDPVHKTHLAISETTSDEVLEILSGDKDCGVRFSLAQRPTLPFLLIEKLAGDEHEAVREAIANNPNNTYKQMP